MSTYPSLPPPSQQRLSLAQQCANVIQSFYSLKFDDYLFPYGIDVNTTELLDPVSTLWNCLKLGAPLCELYNRLGLPSADLEVPDVSDVPKGLGGAHHKCKAATYKFLVALKDDWRLPEDMRFDVRDLYNDDTNGLVKVMYLPAYAAECSFR